MFEPWDISILFARYVQAKLKVNTSNDNFQEYLSFNNWWYTFFLALIYTRAELS